jgi:adenosylhomocysteine nucleosidase
MIRQVGKHRVLYVMAAEAEYGDCLRQRFTPLFTGVGPVEAAVVLTDTLSRLVLAGTAPDLVVTLGSAGSRSLEQASVHQISSVSYRDMDASPLGFEKGRTPFLDLPAEIALPLRIPGIPAARLSTGANIVSGAAYDAIDADMVDMESFAVVRAAMRFNIAVIGLRGISDGAAELSHVGDWTQYLHLVDERLAEAVDALEAGIADCSIRF